MRRRVAVEFVAEMRTFVRRVKTGETAVSDLNRSTKDGREEVRKFGEESDKAARTVADSARRSAREWRSSAGRMRSARREFEAAGTESGNALGTRFIAATERTVRDARHRFAAAGSEAGEALGQGIERAALARLRRISAHLAELRAASLGPFHTPLVGGQGGGDGTALGDAANAVADLADEVLEIGERARTITAASRAATAQLALHQRIALNRIGQPYDTATGRYVSHDDARAAGVWDQATESVRQFREETARARGDVADLDAASNRAAAQTAEAARRAAGFWRDSAGRLRDAEGRYAKAGAEAGQALARGFEREAGSRIRQAAGREFGLGGAIQAALRRAGNVQLPSFLSGRAMLILAGGGAAATAALQGIPPVLAAIGGGLGAIPSLAAGATGSILTLAASLSGVGDAIGEVFDPPSGGGGGGGIDRTAAAVRQLESAERGLARAQRDSVLAQKEVNNARRAARRELRDLGIALGRVALDERDAALSIREAAAELDELQQRSRLDPGGVTELELERARLAYDQAIQSQIEVSARAQDVREDQAAAARAGVEGSEQVQAALRRQADAADQVLDATNAVIDAQEALASAGAGGGGAGAVTAYSRLSRAGKQLVDAIRAQKDAILGLKTLGQDTVLDGLDREFTLTFNHTLPFARRQIVRFGETWNDTFRNLLRLGRDDEFLQGLDVGFRASDRFFDNINTRIPQIGHTLANLFTGSEVFVNRFGDSLLSYLDDFSTSVDRAAASGDLARFFSDAAEQADALLDIGKEVIRLVARIGGMDRGSTLLRDMATALQRFNHEAREMRSFEGVVAAGNAALKGLIDVLMVLGTALGESLADGGTRDAIALFFDLLRAGAVIVGTLATTFSALPDPIQSVILAGGALLLLWRKLSGTFTSIGDLLSRANTRLSQMGPSGAQAAAGLERVGRAAKAAGAALLAMQIATVLVDQFSDAEVKANALTRALKTYGETGERVGELQRTFGKDAEETRKIYSAAADGWVQNTARFTESIPIFGDLQRSFSEAFHDQSFSSARENVARLDAELERLLTTSEDTTAAQAAFNAEFRRSGLTWDEFKALMPEASAAMEELSAGVHGANASQRILNGTMEDAIRITGTYTDAWRVLNGELLSADEVNLRALEAIETLSSSVQRNSAKFDGNSKAARENRIALLRAGEAAAAAAQQKYEETGSIEEANRVYNEYRNQLIATLTQMTGNRAKAIELANQYLKMPTEINTTAKLTTKAAETTLETFRKKIVGLDGKVVNVTVRVTESGYHIPGQGTVTRRWGGITERAQAGLLREADIYSPRHPGRYMIAEPATGGEAFIPRYGTPERSVSIGRRAMAWYGYDVVPKAALLSGQTMSTAGNQRQLSNYLRTTTVAAPTIDYDQLGAAVAQHQRGDLAAVATAVGGGTTVVTVDGVEIARASRAGSRDLDRRR